MVGNNLKVWDWTIDSLDWKYNKLPVDVAAAKLFKMLSRCNVFKRNCFNARYSSTICSGSSSNYKRVKEKGYEFEAYDRTIIFQ